MWRPFFGGHFFGASKLANITSGASKSNVEMQESPQFANPDWVPRNSHSD
jgi:hypothetical protein